MRSFLRAPLRFFLFFFVYLSSRRAIEKWQLDQLNKIVTYSGNRIRMYKELYGRSNVARVSFTSLEQMAELPIVTKASFHSQKVTRYTNRHIKPDYTDAATTSGTSGEPFTILLPRSPTRRHADFIVYRTIFWRSLLRPRGYRIARIFTKSRERPNRRFTHITDFFRNPEKETRAIAAFKPHVIETFSSVLETLVKTVEAHAIPLRVQYVITGGERISPVLREYAARVLGCEVYDRYGIEEFVVVGTECARHDGFHTNCESLYVEVVDAHGTLVPDGQHGRIIITDLYNSVMPFIRYDTGDYGTRSRERCACGSFAPRVWIEGRYSASLTFGGRRIDHLEFDDALEMYMHAILRYLVIKRNDTEAIVQIIPGPAFNKSVADEIVSKMSTLLSEGVSVTVEPVDELPKTATGKSKIVLDLSTNARG